MRPRIFALAAAIMLMAGFAGAADVPPQTFVRYKLVEAELSLAAKDKFYVIFDLEKKVVNLKARGSVFKSWPVESVMQFGKDIPLEVVGLEDRSHGSEQLRVRIQPPEPEKDEAEEAKKKQQKPSELAKTPENPAAPQNITAPKQDALEMGDMPFNYELIFARDVTLKVTADDPGVEKSAFDKFKEDARETYRLYQLKKSTNKETLLVFKMKQADARALYWAMGDSMNVIFWAPPR